MEKNKKLKTKEKNNVVAKEEKSNKKNKNLIVIIIVIVILALGGIYFSSIKDNKNNKEKKEEAISNDSLEVMTSSIEDFDLTFLTLEEGEKNKIYSPLSIKYALAMLNEGAKGTTKEQIDNILGDYKPHKYTSTDNMSFANAMFINNNYKNRIKESYQKKSKR